jgi:DNA transformation protein and related proteins
MSTQKETVDYILELLDASKTFHAKAMFGEYALYANNVVVALICDNQLYVKDLPAASSLKDYCEKDTPYPGAKRHWLIEEDQLSKLDTLPTILKNIAKSRK